MHAEERGYYILHSEVEESIKVTRDKEAVRDDNISGDVLRILGEDGLRMTQSINSLYETGGGRRMSSLKYSCCLAAGAKSCKMQRPSHSLPDRTYSRGSSENTWKKD